MGLCVCVRVRTHKEDTTMKDKQSRCKDKGVLHNIKINWRIRGQHPSSSSEENRVKEKKIISNIRFNLLLKILEPSGGQCVCACA